MALYVHGRKFFINQRLVDYQIVDNVPFETDITPYIKSGEQVQLAVRITDAGGNHDWRDSRTIPWGDKMLPPGHGFGGITGKVSMKVCNSVYVADIYMQNTPQINYRQRYSVHYRMKKERLRSRIFV